MLVKYIQLNQTIVKRPGVGLFLVVGYDKRQSTNQITASPSRHPGVFLCL